MTKPRLSLPLSTLVLLAACNQVTSALTMGGQEQPAAATAAAGDSKTAPADPGVAPVPVPVPAGPTSVDDLLGLVHDGASTYIIVKTPDSLLGVAETVAATIEQPLVTLVAATQPERVAELTRGFQLFKTGVTEARAAFTQAGTDLTRGIVLTSTRAGDDDPVLVFPASSPEAAKALFAALKVDSEITCAPAAPRPGYVACAKDKEAVAAYTPGDAATARSRLNNALPAVDVDALAVFGYISEGDVHFGLGQPAGGFTVHVSAPPDARDAFAAMAAGPADLLRFAPAGTGFMWMKLDIDEIKKKSGEVPPPFAASVGAFNGELLFGGSAQPAALQARLGFTDTASLAALADLAVTLGGPMIHNKPIPEIPGSKVTFKAENLSFGTEKIKALHFGLTGVPQAKAVADQLGLALDAWLYPAEGTLAAVVGVDAKHVVDVKAGASSDATLAALPAPLAASLRAGEVGFIAHMPLDGLQSPELLKLLDGSLAKLPGYNPTVARAALGVAAPLSSTTMWITEHQSAGVIHFAVQTIGHSGDDEGKAALAAAAAPDPAKAFAELATKYPSSPRIAAYQARTGQGGPGALVGSSTPALLFGAASAFFMLRGSEATVVEPIAAVPPIVPPVDPPKADPDPLKADPPKADPPKADPPKADPPKADPPKADPPKADPPKADPPAPGPIKADPVTPTQPKRVGRE